MAALMALGELQGGALATMDDYAQRSTSLREHMRTYGSSVHCFKVSQKRASTADVGTGRLVTAWLSDERIRTKLG